MVKDELEFRKREGASGDGCGNGTGKGGDVGNCITGVCVQDVEAFCNVKDVFDGSEVFFTGGGCVSGIEPVLEVVHHEGGDGVERVFCFFSEPFTEEFGHVAVVAVGVFFFVSNHDGKPLFHPFPDGWKTNEFSCQSGHFRDDAANVNVFEFSLGGLFIGVSYFLSVLSKFFGCLR